MVPFSGFSAYNRREQGSGDWLLRRGICPGFLREENVWKREGMWMKRRKGWQNCICEKLYCKPEWNRKLMCLKRSLDEVYRILNMDSCHGS